AMKIAVMMSALAACCMGEDVPVQVTGTLSCPHYFNYRISLREEDGPDPLDMIYRDQMLTSNGAATPYLATGVASDNVGKVEPVLTIEHNCNSLYKCLCKDFGEIDARVEVTLNVDLAKPPPGLKECDICEDARTAPNKK
ncbi:hypothetical protein PMAYCL1PPCAC_10157, partial [Pristionchus mayeri]